MNIRPLRPATALAALALVLGTHGTVRADEESRYAPLPRGIAAVAASERDHALAAMALAALEAPGDDDAHRLARAQLILLEDVGLQAAARRLAGPRPPARTTAELLHVVAASAHPEADLLLERAVGEDRPLLRMLAADGLGRGRSPRAVPALATLARDEVPAVRIAAARALFALDTPQAVAARCALPADSEVELLATRLRWHRRAEDASADLLAIATEAFQQGRHVPLRMAAADLLALPALDTPQALLLRIVREMSGNPILARVIRWARGYPREGYDTTAMRRIAIQAALTLLERRDLPDTTRRFLIDLCVHWVARPVAMDAYRDDEIPEYRLRRRLPDLGEAIREPVHRRLAAGAFADPRDGVLLLRELGSRVALPVLQDLLRPPAIVPPYRSRTEIDRARYVRSAASGTLQELGRVGDESLARAILLGDEPQALKLELVRALRREPGPWAVPLLAELAAGENRELRSYALDVLQRRPEPEAYALLVADLFERMERPRDRMQVLVEPGGELARAVLARALVDPRSEMKKAALYQFHRGRNPWLCGPEGSTLLDGFQPDLDSPQQVQGYVWALLAIEPARAVAYVRATWTQFPTDSMRMTVLRLLQETNGADARVAAIDFALHVATQPIPAAMQLSVGAVLKGHWTHRTEEVGAFWKQLFASEDLNLRWEAVRAFGFAGAPDVSAPLITLLRRTLDRKALGDDARSVDEQAFAREIVQALAHQPWSKVEGALIDVATGPFNEDSTRLRAARTLLGGLSVEGRQRLMAWLDYTPSSRADPARERGEGAKEAGAVQVMLAAAVGEGAGEADASALQDTLRRELLAFYSPERMARLKTAPLAGIDTGAPVARLGALARGIAHTRHAPTVGGLLDLVFDLRFAEYARVSVRRQREALQHAGTDAAAVLPSLIDDLAHRKEEGNYFGMPWAIWEVLSQVKVLDDEALTAALAHVLDAARADGRLAHFPDLYLYRVFTALLDEPTGAKPRAAEVAFGALRLLEPVDSAIDYFACQQRATVLSLEGRFAAARDTQHEAVRVLAMGNHGDRSPRLWSLQRATLDAYAGAALAAEGRTEEARARFTQGVLRAPNDPDVLNTVAWTRALAGFDLEQAEAEAFRATRLEARVDSVPGVNATDTLAYVLLRAGKPRRGIAVLEPRMKERQARESGLLHWHMAQMYAAAGRIEDASASLVEALTWHRALEAQVSTDPYLAALREGDRLDAILREASRNRVENDLE